MKLMITVIAFWATASVAQAGESCVVTITGRPDASASSVAAILGAEYDLFSRSAYEQDISTLQYSSLQSSGVQKATNIRFVGAGGEGAAEELLLAINEAQRHGPVAFNAIRGNAGDNEALCAEMKKFSQTAFVLPAGGSGVYSLDPSREPSCMAPNILVVAAASGGRLASFSSYGPGVRVAAQGVNLLLEGAGGNFLRVSGTTYPSAMVAGRLAVFASESPLRGAALVDAFLHEGTEAAPGLEGKVEGNRLLKGN